MNFGIGLTMVLYAAIFYVCGFGFGLWWSERQIRTEQFELNKGRMNVSMPVKAEDAAATMKLLAALVEQAEAERLAREQ